MHALRSITLVVLALITASHAVVSAEAEPELPKQLALEDLQEMALEHNPTLVQASMAVQAAEGRYLQAGLYPNPTFGYLADEIGNDGTAGLQGAFVNQQVVTAGKLRLARAVAYQAVEQSRHIWEAQRRRVLNDVAAGYYAVLLAQKMIEVNEQLVHLGEEGLSVAERLRAATEVSQADVLQARIESEMAKLNLNQATNLHLMAWRQLVAVIGRPDLEPLPLVGNVDRDLPNFTWEDSLQRLLAESPELGQAKTALEQARFELARQCAQRVPDIGIGSAVKYDTGSYFAVADVEFSVPWPMYNRNQGNIRQAQADLIAAEHELQRVEFSLYDRLAAAFAQYANSRRQAEVYAEKILPDAKASLDMIRAGYREGEFGYLTLLTAQRTYFQVSLSYLGSLRDLWTQSVELEGLLLRGGLGSVAVVGN